MVNNRNNARSRPQRRRRRAPRHFTRSVKRIEFGTTMTPPPDPAQWISAPWWPITITAHITKDTTFTGEVIHALLVNAINTDGYIKTDTSGTHKVTFRIRVINVRIWGLSRQPITLIINRVNAIGSEVKQLNDFGTPINYSRLGWQYGLDSQVSLSHDDTDPVFSVKGTVNANNQVLVYIHLLCQREGIAEASVQIGKLGLRPSSSHHREEFYMVE